MRLIVDKIVIVDVIFHLIVGYVAVMSFAHSVSTAYKKRLGNTTGRLDIFSDFLSLTDVEEHYLVFRLHKLIKASLAPLCRIVIVFYGQTLDIRKISACLISLFTSPARHSGNLLDRINAGHVINLKMLSSEMAKRILTYSARSVDYENRFLHKTISQFILLNLTHKYYHN